MRGALLLVVLLLAPSLALLVPSPLGPVAPAAAQGTPVYVNASVGLPTTSLWVSKPAFFDLDNDGMGDLTILGPRKGPGDRSLHVFKWDGDSWSNESAAVGTDSIPHFSYGALVVGDLDNDGDWDVGVGSHGADRVDAYLQDSDASWRRASNGIQDDWDGYNLDVGDFNNDGYLDLLSGGFYDFALHPLAGDGRGNWVEKAEGLEGGAPRAEGYFTDVNNDGNLDILGNLKLGSWVYLGDGNGNWTNSSQGLPDNPKSGGEALSWGDFNNDGYVDLIITTYSDWSTRAYLGDGTGNWTNSSAGLPNYFYESLRLADLNNDKNDDLVGLLTSGTVEIHLANGFGSWVKATTSLMQGNAKGWRVNVGDFDRNGHLDIVAGFGTEEETGSIKVWREATIPQQLGVTLTSPDGKEYFKAGAVRFIRWLSAVPAGTGTRTVKLELSTSGSGGPWSLIGEDLPDTGIYQWTVPNVESSDAYIRITLSDNIGNSASDTSDNAFETKIVGAVNQPPTLDILQPDGEGDTADESFTIEWSADDPDGDALTIDLYYDNDTDPDNGMTLIAADLADTGSYDWNTSAVEEGDYYVYGVADDGNGSRAAAYSPGTVRIEHGGGPVNNPPSITITRPAEAGEAAEEAYTVEWEAEDPDGDEVTVDLYYDEDTDPDNGRTLIASDLADTGSYDWDTGEVAEGEYYIYGVAGDPHGATAADYSAGTVTVPHNPENRAPQIALTTPAEAGELTNENYLIEWQTSDPDDDELTLALYFDADTDPDNGLTLIIEGLADTGSYQWDTSPVAAGDYYLYAVADDGQATAAAYSDYTLGISHPPPNRPPAVTWLAPEPGATVQGAVALVITTSPDAVAVALAYRAPGGAWLPLPPARSDGEAWRAEWRTGGLAPGPYELRAAATDAAGWEGEATLALTVATPAPVGEAGGSNGWLWMMFAALAVVAGVALGGYLLWWRPRAEKEWTAAPLGESGPLPPLAEQAPEALARPLFPSDSGGEAQPEWEVEWR